MINLSNAKDPSLQKIDHPKASAFYEWLIGLAPVQRLLNPLRAETVGQASGLVLEVGAEGGANFPFYSPERVERVEAVEPDSTMLRYAQGRLAQARVPITLIQARAEALSFADATFDSAVVTWVFCSVLDPHQAFAEIKRVLKPGGALFLVEHVRAHSNMLGHIQDALVPLTTRALPGGNCHWNRDTGRTLSESGFEVVSSRELGGGLQPFIIVHARRP